MTDMKQEASVRKQCGLMSTRSMVPLRIPKINRAPHSVCSTISPAKFQADVIKEQEDNSVLL